MVVKLISKFDGTVSGKISLGVLCVSFTVILDELVRRLCLGLEVDFGLIETPSEYLVSVFLIISFAVGMSLFEKSFVDSAEFITEFFKSVCRFRLSREGELLARGLDPWVGDLLLVSECFVVEPPVMECFTETDSTEDLRLLTEVLDSMACLAL
jgi:hypothetical protein